MCGRFSRKASPEEVQQAFAVAKVKDALEPSYNIAPTQPVMAVVASPKGNRGLVSLKWGLIPHWAKDAAIASKLINARAETAAEKPSFREAFRKRRCLIPANGFYEWKKGDRQPIYIHFDDQPLFGFAGLYDFWTDAGGQRIATCTILTTTANQAISDVHQRMPVILPPAAHELWLDTRIGDVEVLQPLLQPYAPEHTQLHPVTPEVNKVSFNRPEAMAPV